MQGQELTEAMLAAAVARVRQRQEASQIARQAPTEWVRTTLGAEPWSLQAEILDALATHREVVVSSCNAAGKSFLAACAVLWYLYNHPNSIVVTTAPTDRQVRKILWKEIHTRMTRAPERLAGRLLSQELVIADDWFAIGFTAPDWDPQKMQGFHAERILLVVDEANGVSDETFEGVESMLTGEHNKLLLIGNPIQARGRFYNSVRRPDPDTAVFQISAFDTPNYEGVTINDLVECRVPSKPPPFPQLQTPEWGLKQLRRYGIDSPFFQSRVLGHFPDDDKDALVPYSAIELCQDNADIAPGLPVEIAVDVARFGSDETVIAVRRGDVVSIDKILAGADTMEVAGNVADIARAVEATCIKVDSIGVGGGVADRLRELGLPVVDMVAAERAEENERFANSRAEWFWNLRELCIAGSISLPNDDVLAEELTKTQHKFNSKGLIQIEAKDQIKRRIGRSPDRADAVAMLMFHVEHGDGAFEPMFAKSRNRWRIS